MDWPRSLAPIDGRRLTTIFDLSNRCNLRCVQCYFSYESVFHREPVFLRPERFERLADELLPRSQAVVLSAATEPLTSPHFLRILEITARYHPIRIKMLTNATLMTEAIADALVRSGAAEVQISIDGGTAATFERIRRGARFSTFVRNVRRLTEAKRARGSAEPCLQFNVTLMRSNLDELPRIVDLGAELGIDRIGCRHVVPYDGLGMEEESLSRDPLRANRGLAAMLERAAARGVAVVNFPDYFPVDERPWRPPSMSSRCGEAALGGPGPRRPAPDPRFAAGPQGNLDGPVARSFASSGHLDLHGWALAERGPVVVRIERERFPGEIRDPGDPEHVVLGTVEFQNGRRPDVVAAFPDVPGAPGAGWVYRGLVPDPAWSVGTTMTVQAVAEDSEGRRRRLGVPRRVVRQAGHEAAPWLYCHFPFSHVYVNPEGRLFPYPDCQGSDSYGALGSGVRFEDLWFGEVATELRRRIIERDPPEMCRRCPIFINRRVSDPKLFEARDTQSRYRISGDRTS